MPKGSKRIELKNEAINMVNCHMCDYKICKKIKEKSLKKYLKYHYKSAHNVILTEEMINNMGKFASQTIYHEKYDMGNIMKQFIAEIEKHKKLK